MSGNSKRQKQEKRGRMQDVGNGKRGDDGRYPEGIEAKIAINSGANIQLF